MTDTITPGVRTSSGFRTHFGAHPKFLVRAPGRVNLIGEHTDYNDGFVLPCAIDFDTVIAFTPRTDNRVRAVALDIGEEEDTFILNSDIAPSGNHDWRDYIRGAFVILGRLGHEIGGADIAIAGNIPQGAGLSSSASLLVAIMTTAREAFGLPDLAPKQAAIAARAVETDFVGVQCGIMDQMISACGEAGHALLIDCRSLETTPAALHPDLAILIIHSGIKRGLVDSAYNQRRIECERAAAFFGATALRDVTLPDLENATGKLDDTALRRARHVVTENHRVLEALPALASGDTATLRTLLQASHLSMSRDFEITTPKIDALVDITQNAIGSDGGARMTGGGFGGCIVAVLKRSALERTIRAVQENYRTPSGDAPLCFPCIASAGAQAISASN